MKRGRAFTTASSTGTDTLGVQAPMRVRVSAALAALMAAALVVAGCGTNNSSKPNVRRTTGDREITFDSGGIQVHGSLRKPNAAGSVPAAVLIAGSGPVDRNGDSKVIAGKVGTLSWLADQLEAKGVASLRYDKLGAGKTGLGAFASHPGDVDFDVFVQEARDAMAFLATQPHIDASHLMLVGHSEGGLVALVVATDPRGAPSASALALINPVPVRYLDLIATQLRPRLDAPSGAAMQDAIDALRNGQPVPSGVPPAVSSIFSPQSVKFLRQADEIDPAQLASRIDPSAKALVMCADNDIQVPCPLVHTLADGFPPGVATFVTASHTDHVLKQVTKSDGTEYGRPLPYSSSVKEAMARLVDRWRQ